MIRLVLPLLIGLALLSPVSHAAQKCSAGGTSGDGYIAVGFECTKGSKSKSSKGGSGSATPAGEGEEKPPKSPIRCDDGDCVRNPTFSCPAGQVPYVIWITDENGIHRLVEQGCRVPADPADPDDPGQITPAMVLQALRRVGLPAAEVRTDPADKTLVNLDTIFSTTSETTIRTLSMLGHRVEVEATPSQWVWDFDDGISASTSEPGRPYPHKDLTHRYREAGVTVRPSVDVSYQARFRVEGGPWTTIQEAVTITGPTTRLRVAEAIPVLSGNR